MRRLAQLAAVLLGFQTALAAVLLARGFPYFGSNLVAGAPLWELPVAAFHLPGIEALSAVGLCCGFANGLVLTHSVIGGHIPMRLPGAALLAATNWACWMMILLTGHWARAAWRARPRRSTDPSAGAS
jgi:hypothetical protein